ncbi:MAG: hypothetical protein Q7S57_03155 [bacterium]|nr:hypothetical protein [bacterium]
MVANTTKRKTTASKISAIKVRANDLFNAMERIANKLFDDDELEDTCRRVDIGDTQLWLKPPPMPNTTNFSVLVTTAKIAGWRITKELKERINSTSLDSSWIAWILDGLAGIVQDLQDNRATGFAATYNVCFYETVVDGYETVLAPLLKKAEEAGL